MNGKRRLPIGAETRGGGVVDFRVWAPSSHQVEVILESSDGKELQATRLNAGAGGYHDAVVKAGPGALYRFRLDRNGPLLPDPASRYQPQGPHGPSQVVDPSQYAWQDSTWKGLTAKGQVIYEMHIGTFTQAGTWKAAAAELEELANLGITTLEIMPIAEFPGAFGWGYDGVNLFAPYHPYGTPDDMRAFVDRAHAVGIGVILDVVYNHLGPDGNYLGHFSTSYFTDRYRNDWGHAINFDGPDSAPVREYFIANACYWIEEFHLDGFRLDATQQIFDASELNVMAEISRETRRRAGKRHLIMIAENEPQETKLVRPIDRGGYGLDALWNDDFHHSAMVTVTARNEAYYTDYLGNPQEYISALKYGYLYQGQFYKWQGNRRGTPALDLPPEAFVHFVQNHDQVANSATGDRFDKLTSPGLYRAMTALVLLAPSTPMLLQGQEFAASQPFLYFADHNPALAQAVHQGRKDFLRQFRTLASPEAQERVIAPHDKATFERCKLDFTERESHAHAYRLHKDLLRLRRSDPRFSQQVRRGMDGAVLGPDAFVLRYFSTGEPDEERILLVNFGRDLELSPAPEPLLAPPPGTPWSLLWSSEDPAYGGAGTPPLDTDGPWRIPGNAVVALEPKRPSKP